MYHPYPLDQITEHLIKKYPVFCIIATLTFMLIIVPLIDIAIDHEWFKRKAIEVKYCYDWDGDTLQPYMIYKKGRGGKSFEKAYWMLAYYYIARTLCWRGFDTNNIHLQAVTLRGLRLSPPLRCTTRCPLDTRRKTRVT